MQLYIYMELGSRGWGIDRSFNRKTVKNGGGGLMWL